MKNVSAKLEIQKRFCCCAMCYNGKCSGSARYQATLTVIYFSLSPTHPHCNNIPPHTNISYQSPNTNNENKDNLWYNLITKVSLVNHFQSVVINGLWG